MTDTRRGPFAPEGPIGVLHVDDDESFAETLDRFLADVIGGFSVHHVETAEAALDALDDLEDAVDCVVSDYQMAGMDGLAFSEAVRERRPDLPFVLLTARGSEAVAREAVEAAVTSYLPKRGDRDGFRRLAERIEEAVRERHARVSRREVFDRAGVGLTVRTVDDGTLLAVNDRYCEILGYDRETLLSTPVDELVADETVAEAETDTEEVWTETDAGEAQAETDAGEAQVETPTPDGTRRRAAFETAVADGAGRETWPIRDADGERVWLDVRYEIAEIGGRERVLGTLHDVTARRRRERELQREKDRIEALHDAATRIEACESSEAVYEEIVRAAEQILAFDIVIADSVEDGVLVPEAISSAISEDQYYETTPIDAEDNIAAAVYRSGEPSVVDDISTRAATPASTEFHSVLTVPIGDVGVFQAVSRAVGAFDDTDLELVELLVAHGRETLSRLDRERELRERTEALRREKERSEVFGSVVSHDLRNPLNVATGHLELARETHGDDEHLAAVASALDRMEAITEDVLTLAREDATVEETEPVQLAALVAGCWDNVDTREATLSVAVPEEATLAADPRRLRHVLENLFRNAVEHGAADVRIEVGLLANGAGGWDGFYVADDGPGIPSADRDAVFDPGYSTTEGGTGFGLAIVQQMAAAHGWTTTATASDAGGARFEFADAAVTHPDASPTDDETR
ncbi:ATP-binding protein [Halobaculum sp. MBLA0147]|uniref:hybrid sensor histidine kinase/response regulator n=1 Tax=Halobaculum sp. MBLA0147 TaxID=3079934 RepID=UPI0035264841